MSDNIVTALKTYAAIKKTGAEALLIKRTDHPHVVGDYFYGISASDKHAWTEGEAALTQNEIADLWYAADCP